MNVRNGYCEKHDCRTHEMCANCHNEDVAEFEAEVARLLARAESAEKALAAIRGRVDRLQTKLDAISLAIEDPVGVVHRYNDIEHGVDDGRGE